MISIPPSLIRSRCFKQPSGVSHSVKSLYPSVGSGISEKDEALAWVL